MDIHPAVIVIAVVLASLKVFDMLQFIGQVLWRKVFKRKPGISWDLLIAQVLNPRSKLVQAAVRASDENTVYVTIPKGAFARIQNIRVVSENLSFQDVFSNALDLYEFLHREMADGYTDIVLEHPHKPPKAISLDFLQRPRQNDEKD